VILTSDFDRGIILVGRLHDGIPQIPN